MNLLPDWIESVPKKTSELFENNSNIVSITKKVKRDNTIMKKLTRNKEFEKNMINLVEEGIKNSSWEGILYLMHFKKDLSQILYIGKTEKKGVSNKISVNIKNLRTDKSKFGRWGDGLAYHIGDLSHALFKEKAYKKPSKKYYRWSERIFSIMEPPTLKEKIFITLISWNEGMKGPSGLTCSLPSVEKEIIALSSEHHSKTLLNIDGI